ncbi:MAG: amino acid ABC transporter substrate-binding protein [Chloroflexi bacterium]|nr:amino acid ABC transporter substrate-binding protein [Chloroflexota bacterium]
MRLPSLKGRRLVSALLFAGAALVAGAVIGACTSDEDQQQAQAVEQQTQQQDQDQPAAQVSGEPRGNTLQLIMDRGMLKCGVKQTQPLFGNRDEDGNVTGFDIEFCKAIAAAVLKDADAVEYIDASDASTRFELLADGQIDILIRTTTITSSRDMELDVDFAQTTFYTGQGFAVRKDSGINSTRDMANAAICVQTGTTTEQNVADHFTDIGLDYEPTGGLSQDVAAAFFEGRCDVLTADASDLASRIVVRDNADDYKILPQIISKEPLAPGVRDYDSDWKDVVNWVVHGLIRAEEIGLTQANVAANAANPPNTEVARLLGVPFEGGSVSTLGFDVVDAQFIQRAIAAVGNYGEIYDREIGDAIPRDCTLNALARPLPSEAVDCGPGEGGIMYALPYR